jgi:ribonuclease BN (tRNA processing enzyme)
LLLHWCYRASHETSSPHIRRSAPSPTDIAALAQRANVKQLAVTHLRAHMDTEATHAEILAQLRAGFRGPCTIGEDLMVFDLPQVSSH